MKYALQVCCLFLSLHLFAQTKLSLENLDIFKPQAGNWQIIGDVIMNRNVDIHGKSQDPGTKQKKKKKYEPTNQAVSFTPGTGILLNINDEEKKSHLITKWEHGDIELSLEVMLPKGSNSGIYLQGRYEVQLFDSWGVKQPTYGDMGGIYRNWETEPGMIFKGVPPASNPAKAPGLWQSLNILFKAPEFDEEGNKIKDAKFVYVDLNGIRIHSNVVVPLPTGGPIEKNEVEKGPLMIQGDHGPVAFRNIKYRLLKEPDITLMDLHYQTFKGDFDTPAGFLANETIKSGTADRIDIGVVQARDEYAVIYTGKVAVPESGKYTFLVGYTGGMKLIINDQTVLEQTSKSGRGEEENTISLPEGTHSLKLYNYKAAGWRSPKLGLFIKGENTFYKRFHNYSSYPETTNIISSIYVDAKSKPRLLRAFVHYRGEGPKLSHTMGVGDPDHINYILDLNTANVVCVWRGDFADATPMWHDRGNGTFKPRGAVLWTFLNQQLAELPDQNSEFPEMREKNSFIPMGYTMDQKTGLPIFKHVYKGVRVESKIFPDPEKKYFIRDFSFSQKGLSKWYLKIAEGQTRKMPDGSYAINDQQYYINLLTDQSPIIREVDGKKEMILPVDGSNVRYEIIW